MSRLTRVVTAGALVWGAGYLGWRIVATRAGADGVAWVVLLVAELLGFAVFMGRGWQGWPSSVSGVHQVDPSNVAVVLDATGESAADVRTTLVAVRAIADLPATVVVDERGNRWMRTVAERLGATVLRREVALDDAIAAASTEWVLHLRPGDVPPTDLIDHLRWNGGDDVVAVQLGTVEPDATPHDEIVGPESGADTFERRVLRPTLAARTSVPWYGDSPTLIRRAALGAAGIEAPGDDLAAEADRWWRVGMRLTAAGGRITMVPDAVVAVRAVGSLGERLELRRAITARRLRSLRRGTRPKRLGRSALAAHAVAAIAPSMAAVGRLLQVVAIVLVAAFGSSPMTADLRALMVLAVPAYGLRWWAQLLLGRGHLRPLSLLRSELRTFGADLGALAPSSSPVHASGLGPLVGVLFALLAAVATRVALTWAGVEHGLGLAVAVALSLAAVLTGTATGVLVESYTEVQRRAHRRVRLGMVRCRVEEHDGFLLDVSGGGVSVALPATDPSELTGGSVTVLAFRVPDTDGQWTGVSTIVHVVRVTPDGDGGVRLGLEFDDPTAAPLDAVADFLTARSIEPSPWPSRRPHRDLDGTTWTSRHEAVSGSSSPVE